MYKVYKVIVKESFLEGLSEIIPEVITRRDPLVIEPRIGPKTHFLHVAP